MPDIFDTIELPKKDIFDEVGVSKRTKFQEQQATRFIPQLTKSLYENLPFGKRAVSLLPRGEEIKRTIESTPEAETIRGQLGRDIGKVAPDLAMASPFMGAAGGIKFLPQFLRSGLGFGSFGATKGALTGESPLDTGLDYATSAMLFHGGGKLGASGGELISKKVGLETAKKLLPKFGAIGGGAVTGAGLSPEGEKISGALLGGGLTAMSTPKGFGIPEKSSDFIIKKYKQSVGGKKLLTPFGIEKRNKSILDVVQDINKNTEELPKSRQELFNIAQERQSTIINEIENIVSSADKKKRIDTISVGNIVADFARNKNIKTIAPELSKKAQVLAQDIFSRRNLSIKDAHELMKFFNEAASSSYSSPDPYKVTTIQMYRKAADSLRSELNDTVDNLVDKRYSGLKKLWGSYKDIMNDLAKAKEKEISQTKGMIQSGFDAYLLGDAIAGTLSGHPEAAVRGGAIKATIEIIKGLRSPERNIQMMFNEARRAYPKTKEAITPEIIRDVPESPGNLLGFQTKLLPSPQNMPYNPMGFPGKNFPQGPLIPPSTGVGTESILMPKSLQSDRNVQGQILKDALEQYKKSKYYKSIKERIMKEKAKKM